jgi:hypothetical protein
LSRIPMSPRNVVLPTRRSLVLKQSWMLSSRSLLLPHRGWLRQSGPLAIVKPPFCENWLLKSWSRIRTSTRALSRLLRPQRGSRSASILRDSEFPPRSQGYELTVQLG